MYPHRSRLRSMSTTFAPARASQYSPIQSCGSIWVVHGLYSSDSEVTNASETAGQSTAGSAAAWALKLPTAPFHLPRMLTAAQRCRAHHQHATTLANSLPRAEGLTCIPLLRTGLEAVV